MRRATEAATIPPAPATGPADRHDASTTLPLRHAVALGLLHGPAELLPVSSSGHVTLVPWLLGWPYAGGDTELRKAFEVVLHAGTAAALLIALRDEVSEAATSLDRRRITLIALSFGPPAALGWGLERHIERWLGTPGTIVVGLLAGSLAMALADGHPQRRTRDQAGTADALALGIAQATALMPGVSRNGATLVAARLREFRREDANALSRHVALPVIIGASVLKGVRLVQRARRGELPAGVLPAFAAGAAASFASTLGSARLIAQVERDRSMLPYAAYRAGLATAAIARIRKNRSR